MRYCHSGLWGRGNYFAVNASYSNNYAHIEAGGVRQMLVAYVLTGHSYHYPPTTHSPTPYLAFLVGSHRPASSISPLFYNSQLREYARETGTTITQFRQYS